MDVKISCWTGDCDLWINVWSMWFYVCRSRPVVKQLRKCQIADIFSTFVFLSLSHVCPSDNQINNFRQKQSKISRVSVQKMSALNDNDIYSQNYNSTSGALGTARFKTRNLKIIDYIKSFQVLTNNFPHRTSTSTPATYRRPNPNSYSSMEPANSEADLNWRLGKSEDHAWLERLSVARRVSTTA